MKILIRQQAGEQWTMVESAAYYNEAELQNLLVESPAPFLLRILDSKLDFWP